MLTVEEVAAIPLFSALPAAEQERLARTSADLQLAAGEFAVHEGGEGALFVVASPARLKSLRHSMGSSAHLVGVCRGRSSVKSRLLSGRRFPGAIARPSHRA